MSRLAVYCVQVSDQKQWQELMDRIHGHLQMLKRYVYSKHVTARVEKLLIAGNSMSKVGSVRCSHHSCRGRCRRILLKLTSTGGSGSEACECCACSRNPEMQHCPCRDTCLAALILLCLLQCDKWWLQVELEPSKDSETATDDSANASQVEQPGQPQES